jgi:hypothetical protein
MMDYDFGFSSAGSLKKIKCYLRNRLAAYERVEHEITLG